MFVFSRRYQSALVILPAWDPGILVHRHASADGDDQVTTVQVAFFFTVVECNLKLPHPLAGRPFGTGGVRGCPEIDAVFVDVVLKPFGYDLARQEVRVRGVPGAREGEIVVLAHGMLADGFVAADPIVTDRGAFLEKDVAESQSAETASDGEAALACAEDDGGEEAGRISTMNVRDAVGSGSSPVRYVTGHLVSGNIRMAATDEVVEERH